MPPQAWDRLQPHQQEHRQQRSQREGVAVERNHKVFEVATARADIQQLQAQREQRHQHEQHPWHRAQHQFDELVRPLLHKFGVLLQPFEFVLGPACEKSVLRGVGHGSADGF
jgi:hypothetical protein